MHAGADVAFSATSCDSRSSSSSSPSPSTSSQLPSSSPTAAMTSTAPYPPTMIGSQPVERVGSSGSQASPSSPSSETSPTAQAPPKVKRRRSLFSLGRKYSDPDDVKGKGVNVPVVPALPKEVVGAAGATAKVTEGHAATPVIIHYHQKRQPEQVHALPQAQPIQAIVVVDDDDTLDGAEEHIEVDSNVILPGQAFTTPPELIQRGDGGESEGEELPVEAGAPSNSADSDIERNVASSISRSWPKRSGSLDMEPSVSQDSLATSAHSRPRQDSAPAAGSRHARARSHFSIPDVMVTSCEEEGEQTHFEVKVPGSKRRSFILPAMGMTSGSSEEETRKSPRFVGQGTSAARKKKGSQPPPLIRLDSDGQGNSIPMPRAPSLAGGEDAIESPTAPDRGIDSPTSPVSSIDSASASKPPSRTRKSSLPSFFVRGARDKELNAAAAAAAATPATAVPAIPAAFNTGRRPSLPVGSVLDQQQQHQAGGMYQSAFDSSSSLGGSSRESLPSTTTTTTSPPMAPFARPVDIPSPPDTPATARSGFSRTSSSTSRKGSNASMTASLTKKELKARAKEEAAMMKELNKVDRMVREHDRKTEKLKEKERKRAEKEAAAMAKKRKDEAKAPNGRHHAGSISSGSGGGSIGSKSGNNVPVQLPPIPSHLIQRAAASQEAALAAADEAQRQTKKASRASKALRRLTIFSTSPKPPPQLPGASPAVNLARRTSGVRRQSRPLNGGGGVGPIGMAQVDRGMTGGWQVAAQSGQQISYTATTGPLVGKRDGSRSGTSGKTPPQIRSPVAATMVQGQAPPPGAASATSQKAIASAGFQPVVDLPTPKDSDESSRGGGGEWADVEVPSPTELSMPSLAQRSVVGSSNPNAGQAAAIGRRTSLRRNGSQQGKRSSTHAIIVDGTGAEVAVHRQRSFLSQQERNGGVFRREVESVQHQQGEQADAWVEESFALPEEDEVERRAVETQARGVVVTKMATAAEAAKDETKWSSQSNTPTADDGSVTPRAHSAEGPRTMVPQDEPLRPSLEGVSAPMTVATAAAEAPVPQRGSRRSIFGSIKAPKDRSRAKSSTKSRSSKASVTSSASTTSSSMSPSSSANSLPRATSDGSIVNLTQSASRSSVSAAPPQLSLLFQGEGAGEEAMPSLPALSFDGSFDVMAGSTSGSGSNASTTPTGSTTHGGTSGSVSVSDNSSYAGSNGTPPKAKEVGSSSPPMGAAVAPISFSRPFRSDSREAALASAAPAVAPAQPSAAVALQY